MPAGDGVWSVAGDVAIFGSRVNRWACASVFVELDELAGVAVGPSGADVLYNVATPRVWVGLSPGLPETVRVPADAAGAERDARRRADTVTPAAMYRRPMWASYQARETASAPHAAKAAM
jgi:hypothetical protein